MKKAIISVLAFALVALIGMGAVHAEENSIEGISTVVGSYGHEGFVPYDLTVFGGELVVCDKDNHRLSLVDKATSKGTEVFGSYGQEGLRFPRGVEAYNKQLLVCDSFNNRILFLDGDYKQIRELSLAKEPKDICTLEDKLYILMEDGVSVEVYDLKELKKEKVFSFKRISERICISGSLVIGSGNGVVQTMDVASLSYEQRQELEGAIDVGAYGEHIYVLYEGKVVEYDKDFVQQGEFLTKSGDFIYPTEEHIYIGDCGKALIYSYEKGSIARTYGNERKAGEYLKVSARGTLVAVMSEDTVHIYRNNQSVAFVDAVGAVDIKLSGDRLYILMANSISSYLINEGQDGVIDVKQEAVLNANSSYLFTAMDEKDGVIYICEGASGKLLKVSSDLKVFTTAVSKLNMPISVAVGDDKIFVAQSGFVGVYDMAGNRIYDLPGEYMDLSYNQNLYALKEGAREINCFNADYTEIEPIGYEGYFLGLRDMEAKSYGLYICDNVRKEVMIKTSEKLEITNDNISVGTQAFNGEVVAGQTVKVQVSGAGMLNSLPRVGDIRYQPVSCGIDKGRKFVYEKGRYVAEVSLPSVGNYTLKVKYQKQIYQKGGWQEVQSASGVKTVELPITVIDKKAATEQKKDEFVKGVFGFFKKIFAE